MGEDGFPQPYSSDIVGIEMVKMIVYVSWLCSLLFGNSCKSRKWVIPMSTYGKWDLTREILIFCHIHTCGHRVTKATVVHVTCGMTLIQI